MAARKRARRAVPDTPKPSPKKPNLRLRWYVVKTERRREITAAVNITPHVTKVYVPKFFRMIKEGKWQVPQEDGLLFPGYIFIMARSNVAWGKIADARGVDRIMCRWDPVTEKSVPMPVPYRQMRAIRTRNRKKTKQKIEPRFSHGQRVRVLSGPFESFDGIFDGCAGKRVKVLLSLFGRSTDVELDEDDLRAA